MLKTDNKEINGSSPDMLERTVLVAEMYYIYKMSQQQIADQLSVSRPWISKLLKRAEDSGIVTIEVKSVSSGMLDLERRMAKKFGIKNAKIVKTTNDYQTMADCAKAAAHYLLSVIRPEDSIGLSWGNTLAALAEQFLSTHMPSVTILPLVGGVGMNSNILCNQVVAVTAGKLNAKYMLFHAPAFAASAKERDTFMGDAAISSVIHRGENVDIAVFGAASIQKSTMLEQRCVTNEEIAQLEAIGAVGDISTWFINADGEIVNHPINNRLISCDIRKTRRNARETIIVAAGTQKAPVISAALRGNWCDVLVTDSATADLLMSL